MNLRLFVGIDSQNDAEEAEEINPEGKTESKCDQMKIEGKGRGDADMISLEKDIFKKAGGGEEEENLSHDSSQQSSRQDEEYEQPRCSF